MLNDLDLFIGGEWIPAPRPTFEVDDPATGCLSSLRLSDGTPADARAAVDAAATAFGTWRTTTPRARSVILHRAFELMHEQADLLVELIMLENGKPEADARGEVTYAAEFFRWFAEEAVRTSGSYGEAPAGARRTLVTYRPVGVAALVTPWNFPAAMATRKIAPALAAGCTVVAQAGGRDAADCAARSPGSWPRPGCRTAWSTWCRRRMPQVWSRPGCRTTAFARCPSPARRRWAVRCFTRQPIGCSNASMELGGNAPFIVTEDADLDSSVDGGDGREVPQRRSGLHGGQPVPRPGAGRRRVHRSVSARPCPR